MNDATRELGAALGIACSAASPRRGTAPVSPTHAHLAPADQAAARTSLSAVLQAASPLPSDVAGRVVSAADQAFVDGIHLAAFAGACLAAPRQRWSGASSPPHRAARRARRRRGSQPKTSPSWRSPACRRCSPTAPRLRRPPAPELGVAVAAIGATAHQFGWGSVRLIIRLESGHRLTGFRRVRQDSPWPSLGPSLEHVRRERGRSRS